MAAGRTARTSGPTSSGAPAVPTQAAHPPATGPAPVVKRSLDVGDRTSTPPPPDQAWGAAVVASATSLVVGLDDHQRVVTWNAAAADVLGWGVEVLGRPVVDVAAPEHVDVLHDLLASAHADGRSTVEGLQLRVGGRAVVVQATAFPVVAADGRHLGTALQLEDVSERLRLRAELADAHARLAAAHDALGQRNAVLERSNADLERFAYVASHDLSEPLRAIAGYAGLLERRYSGHLGETGEEYLGFITEGCRRLQALIDGLLTYSRATREAPAAVEAVPLDEVVEEVLASLSQVVADAGAVVEVEGPLPLLGAGRSTVAQVVQNLLSNAIKFRRPGAHPHVRVSARPVAVGGGAVPSWDVVVEDDGIGIDDRFRERVFEPFARLHSRDAYPGAGIGLSTARRLVESYGGAVHLSSSPLGGTAVHVLLPGAPDVPTQQATDAEEAP